MDKPTAIIASICFVTLVVLAIIFIRHMDNLTCESSEEISNGMMNITHEQRVAYLKGELKHCDGICNGTETPLNNPLDCCVDRCCEYYNKLAKQ